MSNLKRLVRPFIPVGLLEARHRWPQGPSEAQRRRRFEGLRSSVDRLVEKVQALSIEQMRDVRFLEHDFIPSLGLNDENLREQPLELAPHFGTGVHIFQYPNQFAPYLAWLTDKAGRVTSYLEIGVRWGGTFILTSEWLRRISPDYRMAAAIDPIDRSPLIARYFEILRSNGIDTAYVQELSTSNAAIDFVRQLQPDMVLIDGDHSMPGALHDHMLVRDHASIIVHHDVASDACPETKMLWEYLKVLESKVFGAREFFAQYDSVPGSFLGIGVLEKTNA